MVLAVNNLVGFGGGVPSGLVNWGTLKATSVDSGNSWGNASTLGSFTIVVLTWEDNDTKLPTAVSIGGQAMTLSVTTSSAVTGVAIATYAGPMSGSLVVTYSGSGGIADVAATVLSLIVSGTCSVVDTDTGTTSLSALTSPGTGGYRIVGSCDATARNQTFTGVTEEIEDTTGGNGDYQHAVAYHLAASAASIGNANASHMAGISVSIS